jgi:SAM-dependent methyltransferase
MTKESERPELHILKSEIYHNRLLTQGYPDLERLGMKYRSHDSSMENDNSASDRRAEKLLKWLSRLIDTGRHLDICVVGCGHAPTIMLSLMKAGHSVTGIEPVASYVDSAKGFLRNEQCVLQGAAEKLPLQDSSQDVVLLENVIEHVDSVSLSLSEAFRVIRPGGLMYVDTNNRHRLSIFGKNNEFRVRLFPYLPSLLKEAYVFHHLHYDPRVADYSTRPAVHWFTYAELCALGREAGFSRFYSPLDVVDRNDPSVAKRRLGCLLLLAIRRYPLVRALALSQVANRVFMYRSV